VILHFISAVRLEYLLLASSQSFPWT